MNIDCSRSFYSRDLRCWKKISFSIKWHLCRISRVFDKKYRNKIWIVFDELREIVFLHLNILNKSQVHNKSNWLGYVWRVGHIHIKYILGKINNGNKLHITLLLWRWFSFHSEKIIIIGQILTLVVYGLCWSRYGFIDHGWPTIYNDFLFTVTFF